jgi:hypothetical protein
MDWHELFSGEVGNKVTLDDYPPIVGMLWRNPEVSEDDEDFCIVYETDRPIYVEEDFLYEGREDLPRHGFAIEHLRFSLDNIRSYSYGCGDIEYEGSCYNTGIFEFVETFDEIRERLARLGLLKHDKV